MDYILFESVGGARLRRPQRMVQRSSHSLNLDLPYLFDETQEIAKTLKAECTPEFYLYDGNNALVYRGRLDGSSPGKDIPITGADLRAAIDALLKGAPVSSDQHPSMGCSIKWK